MKFFQLFRKELKLSSNKLFNFKAILHPSLKCQQTDFFLIFIFVLAILIPSCSDKKEDEQKPVFSFTDSVMVNNEVKKELDLSSWTTPPSSTNSTSATDVSDESKSIIGENSVGLDNPNNDN